MTALKTDSRTQRVIDLLTALATDHKPFLQPWEFDAWMAAQENVFLDLYRHHQDEPRVRKLLTVVDGGSRLDTSVADAVRRTINLAPQCLASVLRDCEDPEKIGWARNVAKDTQEYEISFRGYVEPKRKNVKEQHKI